MRIRLTILLLIAVGSTLWGQPLMNEWINYNNTYYKFSIGSTGLYRISQSVLQNAGLQNVPAEHFQLWRNGKQVPISTSVATGIFNSTDYIEFYGVQNDGEADRFLYRNPNHQFNNQISLQTDTSAYFLTVHTTVANNLRYATVANNVASNSLPAETSFLHTQRFSMRAHLNRGFYINVGEAVYSSTYDMGEGFTSNEIRLSNQLNISLGNLFATSTGTASITAFIAASSNRNRTVEGYLNGNAIFSQSLNGFNFNSFNNTNIAAASLVNNSSINIRINTSDSFDRVVCSYIDVTYPRLFNFNNAANFNFSLPATTQGYFLNISNFNHNNTAPVLLNTTNNTRLVGIINGGNVQFVIPPNTVASTYVLVSQHTSNISSVTNIRAKNFINYSNTTNQGNYVIITNSLLTQGNNNAVEQYKQYRNSSAGGSYNTIIADIDELVDQFAWGIKKHPLSIKNFIRFATTSFTIKPAAAFLIGKGITYEDYRRNESNSNIERLHLIPTFGWPASDVLLASNNLDPVPAIAIGRLSVITQQEILTYLDKIKQHEQQFTNNTQTLAAKAWMKQLVHVAGASDAGLDALLTGYLRGYENIARDTLMGAKISNFGKSTTGAESVATNAIMTNIFNNGINLLTYFGHSAASALDYNLNDPNQFNNTGKYPMFLVNGCSAGNFFDFDLGRFQFTTSLSEKFVLAPQKGAIGFTASTHFGLTTYLDTYSRGIYQSLNTRGYNQFFFNSVVNGITTLQNSSNNFQDYFARQHAEQTLLHGDPVIKLYHFAKPDFLVEDNFVSINPNIISVNETQFTYKAIVHNIGRATGDSVNVLIRRTYPNNTSEILFNRKIKSIRNTDSIILNVPIIASRDRGNNSITITLDNDARYDELSELNNTNTKNFVILEDDIKPIYPAPFAIINKNNIKFAASTANPLSTSRNYVFELDTTALFNSSVKVIKNATSIGGVLEFDAGINFRDSTTYYWRVAAIPTTGAPRYNNSSFTYMAGTNTGFGLQHVYQHLQSNFNRIQLDSNTRRLTYNNTQSLIAVTHGIQFTSGREDSDFLISVNGKRITAATCVPNSLMFNVFDPLSLKPYYNQPTPSTSGTGIYGGFMGTGFPCRHEGGEFNFEASVVDSIGRKRLANFMDWIPNNAVVIVRLFFNNGVTPFIDQWKNDQGVYGVGNTLYDKLKAAGFATIDSFNRARTFMFVYQKNNNNFNIIQRFSQGIFDPMNQQFIVTASDTLGFVQSPVFGPATSWQQFQWRGSSLDNPSTDNTSFSVIGINNSNVETPLLQINNTQNNTSLTSINAITYPYLKVIMRNADSINLTPYQLQQLRVIGTPAPEGAIAPNIQFTIKDTVEAGEPLPITVAYKNISDNNFRDSIQVQIQVLDRTNATTNFPLGRFKALAVNDTIRIQTSILNTQNFIGNNTLFVNVNPNNAQPEQTSSNNFFYKNFFVKTDDKKPTMDVTFDGVHIFNNDIVSAKPTIQIKVKDDAKFLALNDTALFNVQLRYPNNTIRRFNFTNDTLQLIPPSNPQINNQATINFLPYLLNDGNYELIVNSKDRSNNAAGTQEYKVQFQVYNKPMISNLFNYPNPFTTSTAFVFTVTGTVVPQNIRIQILTVTGKVVKEITSAELGPIHIGHNITEYKWDGTDMYGSKLANGVYLYRVITNLNGNSLEKFTPTDANGNSINTDNYFKGGYGKMYLMR